MESREKIGGKDRARFQKMDKERIKGIKRNRKSKGLQRTSH